MLFHRQILTDENAFGADAQQFNPERFLHNTSLIRSKSYSPFGGGPMLCPGRFMARGETLVFLALMIEHFEMEVVKVKPFPRLDTKTGAGFGILGPLEGDDVLVKLAKRKA
jgi:cytochrome P450